MSGPFYVVVGLVLILLLVLVYGAIPRDCCRRDVANQAAASATLKHGIFQGQVQFQLARHCDQDGDGVGEYGWLSELTGRRAVGSRSAGEIRLVCGPLLTGEIANGYHYAIYLPDGAGGALGEPAGTAVRPVASAAAAKAQARHFRAYAWPVDLDNGRQMFCIDETGIVRAAPWNGQTLTWDTVTGGKGWDAPAVWPVHSR